MIQNYISDYFTSLTELAADMAPYLLLGFLFAGILKVYVPANLLSKYLGGNTFTSSLNASILGIPLPLCSCGVLPTGISLFKNGASRGSSVSFLISTPQTGIDSILVTWSMLGLPFALVRPVAALFTGVMGGTLTNKLVGQKKDKTIQSNIPKTKPKRSLKAILHYGFVEMLSSIAKWLFIGLLIAALISVLIPENFFRDYQLSGITGMLVMLVVSIPLYICATASVPIAAVLLLKGISPGALLVFLMAGPATNIAAMTVIGQSLGKKTLAVYLSTLIAGAILFGLLIDYLLPVQWFSPQQIMDQHMHGILPLWLKHVTAILLTILMGYSLYNYIKNKYFKKKKNKLSPEDSSLISLRVEGMTCNNCKMKVEKRLGEENDIDFINVDLDSNMVKLSGTNLNPDKLVSIIEELGYFCQYNNGNNKHD